MKASVCGWYGHHNVGDEAYRLVFPLLFPGSTFRFADEAAGLSHADAVILGGGDVLTKPMLKAAMAVPPPRFAMSVSATSCDDPAAVASGFQEVWVRDRRSLEKMLRAGANARLVPDFAFALQPNPARGRTLVTEQFRATGSELYSGLVAVVVNAHVAVRDGCLARDEAWFMTFAHSFGWVADHINASFLFLPFGTASPWDDRVSNGWVASKSKFWRKNSVFYGQPSPQDALDILSCCDAAVTSRLHAAIFCTLAGVPFLDLTHHDKTMDYLRTAGLEDCSVPYWDASKASLRDRLGNILSNRAREGGRLLAVAKDFRGDLLAACGSFQPMMTA